MKKEVLYVILFYIGYAALMLWIYHLNGNKALPGIFESIKGLF